MGKRILKPKSGDELPVASWHRGLSPDQMQAVDDLTCALTFDIPKTRSCLLRLGVRPLVNNQQLLRIVQLSCAQNLAFLFFLLQEHYSPKGPREKYTLNEQLLLSAIAHLDLPATLQALDKVLPLGVKGKSKSQRTKADTLPGGSETLHLPLRRLSSPRQSSDQQNELQEAFRDLDKVLRTGSQRVSAATQARVRRNRSVRTLPYFQKQPRPKSDRQSSRFVSNPPLYKVKIPAMEATNEVEDRWFADFQFHPIQRTVKAVINYELSHLFDTIDEGPTEPGLEPRELCEFHEDSRSEEREKFLQKQRQRYMDMIDIEATEMRLTKARIIHHLNRDVEEYLQKFGDKGWSPGVPVLRKTSCAACSELVHVSLLNPPKVLLLEGQWGRHYDRSGPMMRLCGGQDNKPPSLNNKRSSPDRKQSCIDCPATGYFKAPKLHKPYILNYERIFEMESQESLKTNEVIANTIRKALSDDDDEGSEFGIRNLRMTRKRSYINTSISRCVRKIFEKSVLVAQMQRTSKTSNNRLFYGNRTRFDPDNEKLMDQMLSDAFQVLAKDRKLVLVTLPNGHQLPELREWIRQRYGKRYGTQPVAEGRKMLDKMMKLGDLEDKLGTLMACVNSGTCKMRGDVFSYAVYNEIMRKADRCKKWFRNSFFQEIFEQTRQCWHAQHILRANNSRGLNRTFFTYLPNTMHDLGPSISPYLAQRKG